MILLLDDFIAQLLSKFVNHKSILTSFYILILPQYVAKKYSFETDEFELRRENADNNLKKIVRIADQSTWRV